MANTGPITVEVKLPDLTARLLNAVKAVMNVPKTWERDATVTVGQIIDAISDAMLPDFEHDEEVCSLGIINCPECAAAG